MLRRIQVDLMGCDGQQLRATTALWSLANAIVKSERLFPVMAVQIGTTSRDDGPIQHTAYVGLAGGYLQILTLPDEQYALCDLCYHGDERSPEALLRLLQQALRPSRVRVGAP